MNNDYDITLVERYFDNELTESESVEFVERLNADDSFKQLVAREKTLIQGVRLEGLSRDLRFLKSVEQNLAREPQPVWNQKTWYAIAASISLVVAVAAGLLFFDSKATSDELFAQYYDEAYPSSVFNESNTRASENAVSMRSQAFDAYDRGDYRLAAQLFTELLKTKQEPDLLLLLGNANLKLDRVEQAKQNFITLITDFDELDIPGKWFLSLCYLKSGDVENARKMLKELGEMEVSYTTKAKELLDKVD
jgi:tetratricopeptide (TPR) repeat protein